MMALRDDSFRFLFLGCRGEGPSRYPAWRTARTEPQAKQAIAAHKGKRKDGGGECKLPRIGSDNGIWREQPAAPGRRGTNLRIRILFHVTRREKHVNRSSNRVRVVETSTLCDPVSS